MCVISVVILNIHKSTFAIAAASSEQRTTTGRIPCSHWGLRLLRHWCREGSPQLPLAEDRRRENRLRGELYVHVKWRLDDRHHSQLYEQRLQGGSNREKSTDGQHYDFLHAGFKRTVRYSSQRYIQTVVEKQHQQNNIIHQIKFMCHFDIRVFYFDLRLSCISDFVS